MRSINRFRFIVSDADGTLLQFGRLHDPQRFSRMLDVLRTKGIPFAVASGRTLPALHRLFSPMEDRLLFFALDGAYCAAGKTPLCSFPIDTETLTGALALCVGCEGVSGVEFCCADASYLLSSSEILHSSERMRLGSEYRKLVNSLPSSPVYKVIFFTRRYRGSALALPDRLHAVYESDSVTECVRADVDKCFAAETVCGALGIPMEDVLAYGDGGNDRTLLTRAGTAVTMYGAEFPVFSLSRLHAKNVAESVLSLLDGENAAQERFG